MGAQASREPQGLKPSQSRALGALLVSLVTWLGPQAPAAAGSDYEDMAVDLLRDYLRIDTTNPPGNELKAALFYKEILEREGIPVELDEFSPGRANLLAVLKGGGQARPLILMNHMDVVPADAASWSAPPFSGLTRDGLLYGRGAADMKSEGILQLLAMIRLKREGGPTSRDVIFLATADEEVDFAGAERALGAEGWGDRLKKAEFLITEGGENRRDASGRPLYFGVQVAQKAAFWLRLRTTGRPGHGSRPIGDSALNRLIRALERIRLHRTEMKVLPSVARFFSDLAPRMSGPAREWYTDIRKALEDPAAARAIYEGDESLAALLRNTVSITVVRAGYKTNVIPGSAEAELDVRLLPGEERAAFLSELRTVIDDPSVEVKPISETYHPPSESSADTPLFRAITEVLGRHQPGVPVTTRMGTGATESALFRPLGVVCYGFTPLLMTTEEDASQHGDDERIAEVEMRRAVDILYEVVAAVSR